MILICHYPPKWMREYRRFYSHIEGVKMKIFRWGKEILQTLIKIEKHLELIASCISRERSGSGKKNQLTIRYKNDGY